MATITIRRLDDAVKANLRIRAATHGRSMEEEAREILKAGLAAKPTATLDLAQSIRRHFTHLGGVDLTIPAREPVRRAPKLTK